VYSTLARELYRIKIIRTTSPIDGLSTWLELFPMSVSKAVAAEYLCTLHTIDRSEVMAIGNDYNDMDLLSWAGTAFVVPSAPDELLKKFTAVEGGLSNAIETWLG
jgi:hydroxymethylpyrimidine pyrophosphatase-like HAD family hydrolase